MRRVRRERALEEARAADVRTEVDRLQARRDYLLTDSATIERVAREKYGLIREGERLYRFADSSSSDTTRSAPPDTIR